MRGLSRGLSKNRFQKPFSSTWNQNSTIPFVNSTRYWSHMTKSSTRYDSLILTNLTHFKIPEKPDDESTESTESESEISTDQSTDTE